MQNILEVKHKVMQEKLQKIIDIINFCYIGEQKEEKIAFLNVMQIIKTKYEVCYEKIKNSKNMNKSIKYRDLEAIVMQGLNKIEIRNY